jgi:radical SAM-linked protein
MTTSPEQEEHRYRLWYLKDEVLRFVGHLDTVKLVERALRRAELPLVHTTGFSKKPRIIVSPPLPLGYTSRMELMDFALAEPREAEQLLNAITKLSQPRELFHKLRLLDNDEPKLSSVLHSMLVELAFVNQEKREFLTEKAVEEFMQALGKEKPNYTHGLLGWGVADGRLKLSASIRQDALPLSKFTKVLAEYFQARFVGGERIMLLKEDGGLAF